MKREELRRGAIVIHVKHGTRYIVDSCNMRFKDKDGTWVDGVLYKPLYKNIYDLFVRSVESFLDEFELDLNNENT